LTYDQGLMPEGAFIVNWYPDQKQASICLGFKLNAAIVSSQYTLRMGQAQTTRPFFCGEKWLEDLVLIFLNNPGTIIFNTYLKHIFIRSTGNMNDLRIGLHSFNCIFYYAYKC